MQKVEAMVHSLGEVRDVGIVEKVGDNQYIVEFEGVRCTAIFNIFSGLFYADDIYGRLN